MVAPVHRQPVPGPQVLHHQAEQLHHDSQAPILDLQLHQTPDRQPLPIDIPTGQVQLLTRTSAEPSDHPVMAPVHTLTDNLTVQNMVIPTGQQQQVQPQQVFHQLEQEEPLLSQHQDPIAQEEGEGQSG